MGIPACGINDECLSACELDVVRGAEFFLQQFPVIALNLDHAVFDCTATAALGFELFRELLQVFFRKRNTADHTDSFTASAFAFPADSYYAIAGRGFCVGLALTFAKGFTARLAVVVAAGGINQFAVGHG